MDKLVPKNEFSFLEFATKVRVHVVNMTHRHRSSHVGTSLSMVDILAVLYNGALKVTADELESPNRDRFVLSKGHGAAGLYATLAEKGFFPVDWLDNYYANGTKLAGHVTHSIPGVEASTGSLGHGLSLGTGMALAGKRDRIGYRVFVLISDGECNEGSIWEPALFAPHHCLDNLVVIIDYNKLQSLGSVEETMRLEPLKAKWESFGWSVREIDGHNYADLDTVFSQIPFETDKPSCIIAHTIKGKGISFMENKLEWHYYSVDESELEIALRELSGIEKK